MSSNSQSVFEWKALSNWGTAIAEYVPSQEQSGLRTRINSFDYVSPDNLGYFEDICDTVCNYDSLLDVFVDRFPSDFPLVRMYHCTRCNDIISYKEKGILPFDLSTSNLKFKEFCKKTPALSGVTNEQLEACVVSMKESIRREGLVYFGLDDRFLIEDCKHYLEYGSEYQQGLSQKLKEITGINVFDILKASGKPTVLCVNIPSDHICESDLRELGENAFYAWAYGLGKKTCDIWNIDFAIDINDTLPPDHIISHYCPDGL